VTQALQDAPAPASPRDWRPAGPPRRLPGERAWKVLARTVHIAAMGLVLGGVAFAAPHGALFVPIALTIASGLLLLGLDLWKGGGYLTQGNGAAVVLKLALLGLGQLFPGVRLEWYLAATAVASVGSHMPRSWRHWSFVHRRVMD
jgi:hypothetical protein